LKKNISLKSDSHIYEIINKIKNLKVGEFEKGHVLHEKKEINLNLKLNINNKHMQFDFERLENALEEFVISLLDEEVCLFIFILILIFI